MPFNVSWHTLFEHLEVIPSGATHVTPLSRKPFRITDVQEHRVLIKYHDDSGPVPLQREQFETLYEHVHEADAGFDLDRHPSVAPTVLRRVLPDRIPKDRLNLNRSGICQ